MSVTKNKLIRQAKEALERRRLLPPKERMRRLIARGIINEKGEVLIGKPKTKTAE